MTATFILPAPAKLNLFLHITGQRPDGYHLLQTLFIFLDYTDQISLTNRDDSLIQRLNTVADVPAEMDLVVKAARLLQRYTQQSLGVDIQVDKRIPMGGGLGGGSSDAATVLVGLNQLWQCSLSVDELATLGLQLGADVPVFVRGQAAWAEGVGEQLTPVDLDLGWYIVIHPKVHVPTRELFLEKSLTRNCVPIKLAAFHGGETINVFQTVVETKFPEVAKAIAWLSGYTDARLTGSGSCIFGPVNSKSDGLAILNDLPKDWFGFVAQGLTQSPLQQTLLNL
jgi:4-diphosphocytidyl-2-C-methyl-D-erythritol kinase